MLEGATIITLEPAATEVGAVSFEEAFGGHSEARGRGAARRANKKAAKKAKSGNRLGRLALAVATGGLVGGAIKTGPQARKDRQKRKLEMIARRGERNSAKADMKDEKKRRRVSRKEMGQEQEPVEEETSNGYEQPEQEETSNGYEEREEPQYEEEEQYEDQEESYEEEAPQDLDYDSDYEDSESEFEAGSTADDTSSFDSENSAANASKGENSAEDKIRWHKRSIDVHTAKIAELKHSLRNGKFPSNEIAKRAKLIRQYESIIQRSSERLSQLMKQMSKSRGVARRPMNRPTGVSAGLNAKFESQRIEVPAADNFSGFDAKELVSKNKNVLIGVGVAALAIIGLHMAGVFKK